jgi:hypothetical protein
MEEKLKEASENYGKEVLYKRKRNKKLTLDEEIWLCGGSITGFVDGAKYQAERMYSEEEVKNMLFVALNKKQLECCITHTKDSVVREVLKQFKKQ